MEDAQIYCRHTASTRRCLRELRGCSHRVGMFARKNPSGYPTTMSRSQTWQSVRGVEDAFDSRLPGPRDVVLIVEVALRSLKRDRTEERESYGRAAIPAYWIVNLVDSQIEVYTDPGLTNRTDYRLDRIFL